jgi:expansin (peptidoglycan-binding protein)
MWLSQRANYINRATAACQRSYCQLLGDRGCHVVSVTDLYGRIFGFLDRSRHFFYQVAPQLYARG